MKKHGFLLLVVIIINGLNPGLWAQEPEVRSKSSGFMRNSFMITPYIAYYSWATSFGGAVEFAINDRFSLGGDVLLAYWSEDYKNSKLSKSLLIPTIFTTYHFTGIPVRNLDIYIGLKAGYAIYNESITDPLLNADWEKNNNIDKNGIFFCPLAGIRFFITRQVAISVTGSLSAIGDWHGAGATGGITFRVN